MKSLVAALALALLAPAAGALDLQGHRGARALAPENSLAAFELGIRLGASTLELDAAITRDGVVVVHHDLEPNPIHTRDAQGRWLEGPQRPIHTMTWDELQQLDIGRIRPGTDYARQFPDQKPIDGTRIPRLSDLFDMVKRNGHTKIRFAIETKLNPLRPDDTQAPEPFAQALVAEIRKAGMEDRVQIMSFDWRTLQVVQRIAPTIPTVYLTAQQPWTDNIGAGRDDTSPWTAGIAWREHRSVPKMIKAAGGRYWSAFHRDLNADLVREAQALGLKVLAWTVNDEATMRKLLDMKVDGLITDRPDLGQRVVASRGLTIEP